MKRCVQEIGESESWLKKIRFVYWEHHVPCNAWSPNTILLLPKLLKILNWFKFFKIDFLFDSLFAEIIENRSQRVAWSIDIMFPNIVYIFVLLGVGPTFQYIS